MGLAYGQHKPGGRLILSQSHPDMSTGWQHVTVITEIGFETGRIGQKV